MKIKTFLVLVSCCFVVTSSTPLGDLFGKIFANNLEGNSGNDCVACTIIIALLEQTVQLQNRSIDQVIEVACLIFPGEIKVICDALVVKFGGTVIKLIEDKQTPDEVCLNMGLCHNATCHLFPLPTRPARPPIEVARSGSALPGIDWPWTQVGDHLPAVDIDGDRFGVLETLRGTHWRGKDCQDEVKEIHPGRRVNDFSASVDHNCNGILGTYNGTAESNEEVLCSGTPQFGYILVGDSAGAHFHVPPQWVTAADINGNTYSDMIQILEDELDWPEMSGATGYMNNTWSGHPVGPVASTYGYFRERNLCMHRDYQNVGVNGARSSSMNKSIIETIARDQALDQPVFFTYSLIGNDVCNGHYGLSHMTTPQEFYLNVVDAMNYLDTKLPAGSHVVFLGLVDGRILYETMAYRIHPIGQLNQDVTYENLYDYLNCLEISPCFGWLNSDPYWRNQTTERAWELNAVYPQIIANNTYKNFDMTYFDTPLPEVISLWGEMGGQTWELIEPVDGFHPNQEANALLAEVFYKNLTANYPDLLPPINPKNSEILKLFGDQGGY